MTLFGKEKMGKAKYISKIDLAKGYWQIPVEKKDRPKTAFTTPVSESDFCFVCNYMFLILMLVFFFCFCSYIKNIFFSIYHIDAFINSKTTIK